MSVAFRLTPLRALLITALAGLLMAAQVRINGQLGLTIGSGLVAALISFMGGVIVLGAISLCRKEHIHLRRKVRYLTWWMWLPGILSALYVLSATIAQPHIGVALLSIATVAGQTLGGLIVDKLGVGPLGPQRVTLARLASIALALLAVIVSCSGIASHIDPTIFLFLLIILATGSGIAVQFALNARIGSTLKSPLLTTLLNFIVGCSLLALITIGAWLSDNLHINSFPTEPWLYVGGIGGASIVFLVTIGAQTLTTLQVALTILIGQMSGALIIDGLLPGGPGISWGLIAGILLTFLAVKLAKTTPKRHA